MQRSAAGDGDPLGNGNPESAGRPGRRIFQTGIVDYDDPLLVCLSLISAWFDRPLSPAALMAGLPDAAQRANPELCVRAAIEAGFQARIVARRRLADLQSVTLPCILLLKGSGACVLFAVDGAGKAEVAVPESGGGSTVELEELQRQYSGRAIFLKPKLAFDGRTETIALAESRSWFWGVLGGFWRIYGHVLIASILINCFAVAMPLFIMNVYDRVVPNDAKATLWVLALGVAMVFLFEFLMRNLRGYFVDVAGKGADIVIAGRLLRQVMAMRLDQKPPSTGALANNLNDFEALREFFTSGTLIALVDLPFIFLFLVIIWLIGGPIAAVPLAAVPAVIAVGLILQVPLRRVVERMQRESAQKHAMLVETIEGLEAVKAVGGEGRIQRQWERLTGSAGESARRARMYAMLSTSFAAVATQLATVGVVIFGVYRISNGDLSVGGLVACTILTGRALVPLGAIAAMLVRLQQSRLALKSLDRLMQAPLERPPERTFLHRPRLAGAIRFDGVRFRYPGQDNDCLNDVSFAVEPGERVGVVGRIGSGKTTLARLLMGLYEPQAGSVLFDGTELRQIEPADVRTNIGYVPQDGYLFYGTVRDNIAFGAPGIDDGAVQRAAQISGTGDFIKQSSAGFDLQVGERGSALSGGQRQAILMARALVRNPPILLFDEPTSSMDRLTETQLIGRLQQVIDDQTMIMFTHRNSLLKLVDRVIVMDGGRIVADGPRDEVIEALKQGRIRPSDAKT